MTWIMVLFWAVLTLIGAFFLWVVIFRPIMQGSRRQKRSQLLTDIPKPPKG
jgi:hypothetical protein